jgi:hypothetical protein
MKDSNDLFKLISKYALLLSLFYFVEILFLKLMRVYGGDIFESNPLVRAYIPIIVTFGLNIITAIVVNNEGKNLNIRRDIVTVATLLFRPVGAVALILFAIAQSKSDSEKMS